MGNSPSHPIFLALNELLRSKNLKLKKSTLGRFLEECDTTAPWFAVSGKLTTPSWEKLGRDLEFAAEQGTLKAGVRPIWKLVKSCLEDRKCNEAVENGQAALEKLQEERSERAASETAASKRAKSDVASDTDSGRGKKKRAQEKQKGRLYPSLSELEESDSSVSSSSETGPDPETPDTETEMDEEDRENLRKTLKRMKISKKKGNGGKNKTSKGMRRTVTPSAPPLYPEVIVTEGDSSITGAFQSHPIFWLLASCFVLRI